MKSEVLGTALGTLGPLLRIVLPKSRQKQAGNPQAGGNVRWRASPGSVHILIDSGRMLHCICEVLNTRGPASLKICTLLDKYERREVDVQLDYVGFHIVGQSALFCGKNMAKTLRTNV